MKSDHIFFSYVFQICTDRSYESIAEQHAEKCSYKRCCDAVSQYFRRLAYLSHSDHNSKHCRDNTEGGKTVCVYRFLKDVGRGEEVLGDYGDAWRGLADWSRRVNDSADADEEREWRSFLSLGLYNLGRLSRPGEEDA